MTDEKQTKWKRAKQRRGYTVQLIVGQDSDLIQYMDSMEKGQRAKFMWEALYMRAQLPLPAPAPAVNGQAIAEMQAQLETLAMRLETVSKRSRGKAAPAIVDEDIQRQLDEINAFLSDGIQALIDQRASAIASAYAIAPDEPLHIQASAEMSDDEAHMRGRNIDQMDW